MESPDLSKIVLDNAPATAIVEAKKIYELEKSNSPSIGVRSICLSKSYGNNHALKNVSFDVPKGQLLGVMGHNGAGKSTLINSICGCI